MNKYIVALLFASCQIGFAQTNYRNLSSPRASLHTLLYYQEQSNYNLSIAASTIKADDLSQQEKFDLAIKIKQLLDGSGIFIYINDIPDEENYTDTTSRRNEYIISSRYPEIKLTKFEDKWQFSSSSVKKIIVAHDKLLGISSKILPQFLFNKSWLKQSVFGLGIGQWLALCLLAIIAILIKYILSLFFKKIILRLFDIVGQGDLGREYILPITRPMGIFVTLLFLIAILPAIQLPVLWNHYIFLVLKTITPVLAVIIFYRAAGLIGVYLSKLAQKTESNLDDQLVPLVTKILKIIVAVIGGLLILDTLNIPILPLLTGLSIGGLAFALAAQDTIKNFFGSLMIFIDKPFHIGDWITSDEIDGTVEEVGFRSTRIRTFRNSVIYVPNGKLADRTIDNHGLRKIRRYKSTISLKYDTPAERIEVFVEGLKTITLRHPKTNKKNYQIHLNAMGDSSLEILFYIFFEANSWTDELKFRQEIILEILKLGKSLNVHFAFPTQTLNIENMPGQQSLSPNYTYTKTDLEMKLKDFLDKQ